MRELVVEGFDTKLKDVLTRSSSCGTLKHLRSVLLSGPYTTICNYMKIARYGENCSVPSLECLHPHLGIYEFTACALRRERESRAAESKPPKTSMIDTIRRKRHAFLTRYFLRCIQARTILHLRRTSSNVQLQENPVKTTRK